MFWTAVACSSRHRPDRRPLYRRIFTNRRLDIAHKTAVRSIFGFLIFSTSYVIVNSFVYYQYVRPVRQEEREKLERELIEADKAGFGLNWRAVGPESKVGRRMIYRVFALAAESYAGLFSLGVAAGASFELFKINFSFNGVSFYSVFKKKQLAKELEEFERGLMELDEIIDSSKPKRLL